MKKSLPKPPRTFNEFSETFPTLRKAWDILGDAAKEGPLDDRTARLVKLGVAIGAMREGAVHSRPFAFHGFRPHFGPNLRL